MMPDMPVILVGDPSVFQTAGLMACPYERSLLFEASGVICSAKSCGLLKHSVACFRLQNLRLLMLGVGWILGWS